MLIELRRPSSTEKGKKEKLTRAQKIAQLTGRKDSVKHIEQYLYPESAEEAKEMASNIEKSDRMKKVFGQRPEIDSTETQ